MLSFDVLKSLEGLFVRGTYEKQTKSRVTTPVEYRKGVDKERFQGFVEEVRVAQSTGNVILVLTNQLRQNPGKRSDITEADLDRAAVDERFRNKLPGKYQVRSLIMDGITNLAACFGSQWRVLLGVDVGSAVAPTVTMVTVERLEGSNEEEA